MPIDEQPIHERCTQHKAKCQAYTDLKETVGKHGTNIEELYDLNRGMITMRTFIGIVGILVVLAMAVAGFFTHANLTAMEKVEAATEKLDNKITAQRDLILGNQIDLSQIKGKLDRVRRHQERSE